MNLCGGFLAHGLPLLALAKSCGMFFAMPVMIHCLKVDQIQTTLHVRAMLCILFADRSRVVAEAAPVSFVEYGYFT